VRWETKQSFDGKLWQKYFYQKLSESDNWFSSYSQKCRGCFLRHSVLQLQSAYRPHHSVETAVAKVMADIYTGDRQRQTGWYLALLALSVVFGTVDHDVLLQRQQISYSTDGMTWMWFRFQYLRVRVRSDVSPATLMRYGVPQGSVLGPILFLLYTANLVKLVQSYSLYVHLYADDIQIYGFSSSSVDQLQMRMSACVDAVAKWMSSNRLQLNVKKTKFLWCTSARRQR